VKGETGKRDLFLVLTSLAPSSYTTVYLHILLATSLHWSRNFCLHKFFLKFMFNLTTSEVKFYTVIDCSWILRKISKKITICMVATKISWKHQNRRPRNVLWHAINDRTSLRILSGSIIDHSWATIDSIRCLQFMFKWTSQFIDSV